MIHTALWIASALFLAWVGCIALGLLIEFFENSPTLTSRSFWDVIAERRPVRPARQKVEACVPARNLQAAPTPAPIPKPKVLIVRLPAKDAEEEFCKCGYPGCLGHERLDVNKTGPLNSVFPGITSAQVMAEMMERGIEFDRYDVEICGVPGNPR